MSLKTTMGTRLSASLDRAFGERLRFEPRREALYTAGGIDPSRSVAEIVGIYDEKREELRMLNVDGGVGRDFGQALEAADCRVSFDRTLVEGIEMRRGDRLVRLEASGQPVIELLTRFEDGARTSWLALRRSE